MFSSDFSPEEVQLKLGHLQHTPTLIYLSMKDEYVPESVDKNRLIDGIFKAIEGDNGSGGIRVRIDENANHNLSQPATAAQAFVDQVVSFLQDQTLQ